MDIHHAMIVRNNLPERLFVALTQQSELSVWMDAPTLARPEVGAILEFHYDGGKRTLKLEVTALDPGRVVQWQVRQPVWTNEPVDQVITWTLSPYESSTLVDFRMTGWREDDDTYASVSYKWTMFMLRLRIYLGDTREIATFLAKAENRSPEQS